jgi:hypothetical protein
MKTFIFYLAERVPGQQEMQRFGHPIHVGMVTADDFAAAYERVVADLVPTFADHPQDLEVRFQEMVPPRGAGGESGAGIWKHRKPVDMDITFTASD